MNESASQSVPFLHAEYSAVIRSLSKRVREQWSWPSAEGGFVLLVGAGGQKRGLLSQVQADLSPRRNEAPVLAACGYAARVGHSSPGLTREHWIEGVVRLSERKAVDPRQSTFAYRPHDVLGIALGIAHHDQASPALGKWLLDVIEQVEPEYAGFPLWKRNLLTASARVLGARAMMERPGSSDTLGLAYWAVLGDLDDVSTPGVEVSEWAYDLLRFIVRAETDHLSAAQAAAVCAALERSIEEVLEPVIEDYLDSAKQEVRKADRARAERLEQQAYFFEQRVERWGTRYERALKALLMLVASVLASLISLAPYRWLDDQQVFENSGPWPVVAFIFVAVVLVGYSLVQGWDKSPAKNFPPEFAEWNRKRIRRRWTGSAEPVNTTPPERTKP